MSRISKYFELDLGGGGTLIKHIQHSQKGISSKTTHLLKGSGRADSIFVNDLGGRE